MTPEDEVRALFVGRVFGTPCAAAEIQQAETELGEPLPESLARLYRAFNGFRGPTDAQFLWPLLGPEGLVEMNQFFRSDESFPHAFVSQCIFFGDNGCGAQWGLKRDLPGKVIQWDASWGTDFKVADSLIDAWRIEKQLYEEADQ